MSRKTKKGNESCLPDSGFQFMMNAPPTVRMSGAVSPMTRATPKITAVTSPDREVGSTTREVVRHSVPPKASDASRNPPGTRRSTTSAVRVTVGRKRTDNANEPARPVCWLPRARIHAA